jgi:CheY-like chemotaxis protein
MLEANAILVVDDSKVMRELLHVFLAPHSHRILTAACCEEALAALRADPTIELVLCDVVLPDGDGFDVLEHVVSGGEPKPKVIMMTASPRREGAERARQLGAIAYLGKPISLQDIRAELRRASQPARIEVPRAPRRRAVASVRILERNDGEQALLSCALHNVSRTGALLETDGPLPVGARLEMEIHFKGTRGRARGSVVRVQKPSWLSVGGVGVQFESMNKELAAALDELLPESDGPDDASTTGC